MGIYGEKKDYEQLVKENIEKANLLYGLNDKDKVLMESLLEKREKLREKNGLLANIKINKINKKIDSIKQKYKK